MRIYVEVLKETVRHKFSVENSLLDSGYRPQFAPPVKCIDVTDIILQPDVGWTLNQDGTFSEPIKTKELFLHIELSDGDGMEPIGIANDGIEFITVKAALRSGSKVDSAILPVNKKFRILIRDSNDNIYDNLKVTLTDGQVKFEYSTKNNPNICCLKEEDLKAIKFSGEEYEVRLVGNIEFEVYRNV